MKSKMDSERCRMLQEGFLDVKFPPESPERVLHKAWRKLWACAAVLYPPGRGEPHFILQLRRGQKEKRRQVVKASRDGLRLFRCRSGTRPLRTWALSSGTSLLVYLAAETEEVTQHWMQIIRDGLWPPIHALTTDTIHEVSLIDDDKSFSSGLLGLYGRLVKISEDVMTIVHPHWQGTMLRWKVEDVLSVRLVRKVSGERNIAGVFKITLRSSGMEARTLLFYSSTAVSAVAWIQSKIASLEKLPKTEDPLTSKQSLHLPTEINGKIPVISSPTEYAVVRKSSKQLDVIQEDKVIAGNISSSSQENIVSGNTLFANMSSDLLNASISSLRPPRQKSTAEDDNIKFSVTDADSEESSDDSCEHIYEDLPYRKSSASAYTLYEEMNDSEDEYVPPLPPQLPNRPIQKPNSLRLLKLSESVIEALKMAEEKPLPVESLSVIKKVVDKCKSLQSSPMRETASSDFEGQTILKRTTSEPDVSGISSFQNVCSFDPLYRHNAKVFDSSDTPAMKWKEEPNYHTSLGTFLESIQTPGTSVHGKDIKISDTKIHNNIVERDKAQNACCISKCKEDEYIHMR